MTEETMIPARRVLITAEETNRRLGHENLGFLSETYGFLPTTPPLRCLPPAYEIWDQVAAELPQLYANLAVRRVLDALPILDAGAEALPDQYLLRASVIISAFAHTYHYSEPEPPDVMPVCIQRPWEQISQRLNRPGPHQSTIDLVLYNWQLIDLDCCDPMRMANLKMMVPLWANEAERIFNMTAVEFCVQSTPIVGAVVRAQEAVRHDDVDALTSALIRIAEVLNHLTHISFMRANPNPHSDSHVDPVVWAKTFARVVVPLRPGSPGPSGAMMPAVFVMDEFFGRTAYNSQVGHEIKLQRAWSPKHWREFLQAIAEISVADYVARKGNKMLTGIFRDAMQAYAGSSGFLSRHRLKASGYLDTAFRVGRSLTVGGFSGRFKDRPWNSTIDEIEQARRERHTRFQPDFYHYVPLTQRNPIGGEGTQQVQQIVFNLTGAGVRYQPGDRVALLPENSDELVAKTLQALRARGDEPIQLNAAWRAAVSLRHGYQGVQTLALRALLRFGRIRPVDRPLAKALYAITYNETLKRIIAARTEDQWELWDLLKLLAGAGFNPRTMWKAKPGDRQHICSIVTPETYRLYSISSAILDEQRKTGTELHLTAGHLHYQTEETPLSTSATRVGTASTFLNQPSLNPSVSQNVALRVVHPPRFRLPRDETRPIVMFAGGAGLAPFRGFLQARAQQAHAAENWLFFGTRTRTDFHYQKEIEQLAAQGKVQVRVAFSREDAEAHFVADGEDGQFVFAPGERRHIHEEMLRPENARLLWDLLRSRAEGGREGFFYVCGQTGFASTVMAAIKTILERFVDGPDATRTQRARECLYRLVGQERYMQDIFTTYNGSQTEPQARYDASEVVLHNNDEDGYWIIIDDRVYDLTEFIHLHPGGSKIILTYAGMDATYAYQKIQHHINPEIDARLGTYEIGVVRRLDFGAAWGVAGGPKGLRFVTLEDTYRLWLHFLYFVIELENTLHNDFSVRTAAVTYDETRTVFRSSPLKLQLLIQIQQRFIRELLPEIIGEALRDLWMVVNGVCTERIEMDWMETTIAVIHQTEAAQAVKRLDGEIMPKFTAVLQTHYPPDARALQWFVDCCDLCEREDKRFLREMHFALRAGLQIFEAYERETLTRGAAQLLAAIKAIPDVLEGYYKRMAAGLQALDRTASD